jgi:hypothetical protein
MPWGRGGTGSTKHGKSGHSGPSPRAKFHRALDASREDREKKRPKNKLRYGSVPEALKKERRRP